MNYNLFCFLIEYTRGLEEGSPNGMALVLKTSGRNPLQVRVLYPPQRKKLLRNFNVAGTLKFMK